nr:3-phosphoserine/phosphohydroxythreonine transaminase [bacterium]
MDRIFNFSAGPSMLPLPVLEKAQRDLINYHGSGMSVMEMSHRSPVYEEIIARAEATLRDIMDIPKEWAVLFLQGGASTQFAMVPLNLMPQGGSADYAQTGMFAAKAAQEAAKFGTINIISSSKADNYTHIPAIGPRDVTPGASYVHITTNNTIFGTTYPTLPETGGVPLVADMSSNILGQVYDVRKFGLIYAGAQKNMGPAGLTVVIIRRDLLGHAQPICPTMLDYKTHADSQSMYNTPPCWSIYVAGLVFEWIKEMGGVAAIEKQNREKAALLYDVLDQSNLFTAAARRDCRSIMNVTFTLPSQQLTDAFLKEAKAAGLVNLKGHRAVGGIRASIYNAMPVEGVQALAALMQRFEARHA